MFDPAIEDQLVRAILAQNQGFTVPTSYFRPGWESGQLNIGGRSNPSARTDPNQVLQQLKQALEAGLNPGAAGHMNPYAGQQSPDSSSGSSPFAGWSLPGGEGSAAPPPLPELPPGADLLDRLGFYEVNDRGRQTYTNFDPHTGAVNPRSQVPYDQSSGLPGGGPNRVTTLGEAMELAKQLKASGLPEEMARQVMSRATGQMLPTKLQELEQQLGLRNKLKGGEPVDPRLVGSYFRYNSSTGDLEGVDDVNKSPKQLVTEGYRFYDKKQLDTFYGADMLTRPMQEFKSVIDRAAKYHPYALQADAVASSRGLGFVSPLDPEDIGLGVEFKKSVFNVTQLFDQLIAGARGAASPQLAKLRSEALPGILNEPQLRDKLFASFSGIVDDLQRLTKAKALGIKPTAGDLKRIDGFENEIGQLLVKSPGQAGGAAPGAEQGSKTSTRPTPSRIKRQADGKEFGLLPGAPLPSGYEWVK